MPGRKPSKRLKKELGLFDVYAIATGATLSSGFFLLPGLAAVGAGPALPLSYLIAALFLVPGLMSLAELATAMPRAGGVYYFLDRSMGPLLGTIGGFGTWISLVLKSAFALVGVGAYLGIFLPDIPLPPIAAAFAIVFGIINLLGAKKSGAAQVFLVMGLLLLLLWFSGVGILQIEARHFRGFFDKGVGALVSTAGLVVVSYMGLTKVASVAEEVKNPERNLPLGMFLALGTALLVYLVGTSVMVGVVSVETLARDGGDLTPVATVAEVLVGRWGAILMTVGAVLAFSSVTNAGILSSSRYPLAMSRDHLLPRFFGKIGERGAPNNAIYVTVALILLFVTLFDPTKIAKLASTFQLLMFALSCLAVIVMRASRIESYDPGYRSPFYPWLHGLGIVAPIWLITQMGWLPIAFTGGVMVFGAVWYRYYARDKVVRSGAIYHIFERLGRTRYEGLDRERRGILKEKGLRAEDPFDEIVARSLVLDLQEEATFEDVVEQAAGWLAQRSPLTAREITTQFLEGTRMGATPVTHGVALPHLNVKGLEQAEMVLVRSRPGVHITFNNPLTDHDEEEEQTVHTLFFLVSPKSDPAQHLRILAQIAGRVDDEGFDDEWNRAEDEQELKEVLLRDERFLSLLVSKSANTASLIGRPLREIPIPEDCLVALLRRDGKTVIPRGNTVFQEGDRLTIIGHPYGLHQLSKQYADAHDGQGAS